MRRRIWLAISLAFLVLAGWLAFLQFEPRLFPVPDHELIVLAEFERLSHLYISAAGRVVEGKWFPIGDFDSAGMARVLGTPQDTDRILDDAGGDPSALQSYFGWIDRAGRVAIPCDWHDAHDFDDQGWAAVKRSGKWGWIDRAGVVVIAPGWQSFDRFDAKGEALVRDSDGCWIVDRAGNVRPVDEKSADPEIRKRMALLPGAVVPLPSSILAREVADGACIAYLRQGYQSRTYRRHPLVNSLEAVSADLADWLGARKPFRWLDVVLSPSGAVIWRSDVHYFRFLLLPAAGISLVLAALSFRRYRVHRRRLN